jgi:hypothetical protein
MAAGAGISVLLVSHNVSGIFDDLEDRLSEWIDGLVRLVALRHTDFLALHLQEVGGTRWREQGSLSAVAGVTAALERSFPEFWSSGMFVNLDTCESPSHPSAFTALGSIYLVRRKTSLSRISLWRWAADDGVAGEFERLSDLPNPLQHHPGLPAHYSRHARFPQSIYPEKADWSRKGRMLTRWRLDGCAIDRTARSGGSNGGSGASRGEIFDLLNIHNFHDECNLRALHVHGPPPALNQGPPPAEEDTHPPPDGAASPGKANGAASPGEADGPAVAVEDDVVAGTTNGDLPIGHPARLSPFAVCRRRALALVISDMLALSAGLSPPPAVFLFGDFNFRLDLAAVIRLVCGDDGLRAVRAADPKQNSLQLHTLNVAGGPLRTAPSYLALETTAGHAATGAEMGSLAEHRNGDAVAQTAATAGARRDDIPASKLDLGRKCFRLGEPRIIGRQLRELRNLDFEPGLQAEPQAAQAAACRSGSNGQARDRHGRPRPETPSGMLLHELPVLFAPTYAFEPHGGSRSPGSAASESPAEARAGKRRRRAEELRPRLGRQTIDGKKKGTPDGVGGRYGSRAHEAGVRAADGRLDLTKEGAEGRGECEIGEAWCAELGSKRCPAWCDRVLMNDVAMALVRASAEAPVYDAEMQRRVITDHNKVYLRFTCG